MLFAGQWLDEESGFAYNRFRYYYPESDCYISSDPIGLAGCPLNKPSKKSSYFATSRKDAFNKAKRDAGIPKTQQPYKVEKVSLKDGYGDFVRKSNGEPVKAREYYYKNSKPKGKDIVIQEHSLGHSKATTGSGKEPHFNVRPIDNINTGYVPGTYGHYNF